MTDGRCRARKLLTNNKPPHNHFTIRNNVSEKSLLVKFTYEKPSISGMQGSPSCKSQSDLCRSHFLPPWWQDRPLNHRIAGPPPHQIWPHLLLQQWTVCQEELPDGYLLLQLGLSFWGTFGKRDRKYLLLHRMLRHWHQRLLYSSLHPETHWTQDGISRWVQCGCMGDRSKRDLLIIPSWTLVFLHHH